MKINGKKDILKNSYTYSFNTIKSPNEIFELLLGVENWWIGIYGETITGFSKKVGDEFSFKAGDGAHYSKQRLIELNPNKKIVWLVTESHLSFLNNPDEWVNTKIGFEISQDRNKSKITFSHKGLIPKIECYDGCSGAWTKYLQNLEKKLNQE